MSRERRQLFLALDPGDRWTGVAVMMITPSRLGRRFSLSTGVVDMKEFGFRKLVDQVTPGARTTRLHTTEVIMESFRQRPLGHQAFSSGETLQLIGAVRYLTLVRGGSMHLVPAADPDEVHKYGLWRYIGTWRLSWPDKGNTKWHHAKSAWRVLSHHLLTQHKELLQELRSIDLPDFTYDASTERGSTGQAGSVTSSTLKFILP
jgi:hypothetical protein